MACNGAARMERKKLRHHQCATASDRTATRARTPGPQSVPLGHASSTSLRLLSLRFTTRTASAAARATRQAMLQASCASMRRTPVPLDV